MAKATQRELQAVRATLDKAAGSRMLQDPMSWVDDRRILLDRQRDRLAHGLTRELSVHRETFARLAAALDALSPLKVLARGYAIAQGAGGIVTSTKDVALGEELDLRVSDGSIYCEVKRKK